MATYHASATLENWNDIDPCMVKEEWLYLEWVICVDCDDTTFKYYKKTWNYGNYYKPYTYQVIQYSKTDIFKWMRLKP